MNVRLDEHNRRLLELERTQPAVIASVVKGLNDDVLELRADIRAMKRAFYSFAISIAGGALTFAFTMFTIFGGH